MYNDEQDERNRLLSTNGPPVSINDPTEGFEIKELGYLSSDSDSIDDDALRSVDAFSEDDEKERFAVSYEDI